MNSRVPPISDSDMTPEQRRLSDKLRVNGVLPNGFRVGMQAWDLFQAHLPFSAYVMGKSSVPPRLRELAIIRIAHLNACDYEFRHHAQVGLTFLNFSQEDIRRIQMGPDDPGLDSLDALVLTLVEELREQANVSDEVYATLAESLGQEALTELMFTIGNYESMTRIINVLGIPMDEEFAQMYRRD